MSSNGVLIGLVALSVGMSGYVAIAVSGERGDGDRVAQLERELVAANDRAAAVEGLQSEVRKLRTRLEHRMGRLETRVEDEAVAASVAGLTGDPSSVAGTIAAGASDEFGDKLVDKLEKRLGERMEKLAQRQRNRAGEWKAPIDELSNDLELDEAQKAEATLIFNEARDETYVLLKTMRLDGGSLLDDFVESLRDNPDPGGATRDFFRRIMTEKLPGSDRSYLGELMALQGDVKGALAKSFSTDQMTKLESLNVDLLDVKTGYDPIGDYVRAKLQ